MRTIEQIDAELAVARAAKDEAVERCRTLVREREASLANAVARRAVERLSPEQRAAVAHEIAAIGIPSQEQVGPAKE